MTGAYVVEIERLAKLAEERAAYWTAEAAFHEGRDDFRGSTGAGARASRDRALDLAADFCRIASIVRNSAPEYRVTTTPETWTLEQIDVALYAAHREWDASNMASFSSLMEKHLRAATSEEAPR